MRFKSSHLIGISIDRLNTLSAVIENGTIAAAAGPDPNRQSQFSRQLKELEQALGINLFERVGKTLQPNATGRRVGLVVQTFFGALDDIIDSAQAQAETIRLGAGEAVLRWLVMPHLGELMSGDPPLGIEVHNVTTDSALREILAGNVDIVIMRTDSAPSGFTNEIVKTVQYVLAVPRALLPSREAAEVFEGVVLPFAELAGDGHFSRTVQSTAVTLGLNLRTVIKAQTFSLLVSAVESGTAAAFLPEPAARSLPEQHFAVVSAEGMNGLNRSLSLVWSAHVAESRPSVRRAITRLRRILA